MSETIRPDRESPDARRIWIQIAAVALAAAAAGALFRAVFGAEPPGWFTRTDFSNYWFAANLFVSGQPEAIFAPATDYIDGMRAALGAEQDERNWSYPPHYLLLIWPLGLVGYPAAFAAFMVVTGALFVAGTHGFAGNVEASDRGRLWALLVPGILMNIVAGQNGLLFGGLLLFGLTWREHRPILAGVVFGLLTVKPQYGLLVPILLLFEKRWQTIGSACMTVGVLFLLSSYLLGIESWRAYFSSTAPFQSFLMIEGEGSFLLMMPTVFGSLRVLGFEGESALRAHLLSAIPAVLLACFGFVRASDAGRRASILMVATFLFTPYALSYDLAVIGSVAAVNRVQAVALPGRLNWNTLLTAVTLLPLASVLLGIVRIPASPLLLWALLVWLLLQARSP